MWIVGLVAGAIPWTSQAQDRVIDTPKAADGLVIYLDFQPAAMAMNWKGFHRSTDKDTVIHATRPELDRHVEVVVIDEQSKQRVDDARVEITLLRKKNSWASPTYTLDKMFDGPRASYGTVIPMDPSDAYTTEVAVRRPNRSASTRVRFEAAPVR
jgi:hypothetical protein